MDTGAIVVLDNSYEYEDSDEVEMKSAMRIMK